MSKLYIIGGWIESGGTSLSTCYTYDINIWNEISNLNEKIYSAACTVFEGKIIVAGGYSGTHILKSVEAIMKTNGNIYLI